MPSADLIAPSCVARPRRLDEKHIGAGIGVEPRALDRRVEAFARDGVGTRDDQRLVAAARVGGGPELARHLGRRNQRLVGKMPAALWKALILELNRRRAGLFEDPHRARDVERVAIASITIDDDRRLDALAHEAQRLGDFRHRDEADIGRAEPRIGDGGAGKIHGLEARTHRERGGERIIDAGRDDDASFATGDV